MTVTILVAVGGVDEDRTDTYTHTLERLGGAGDVDVHLLHVYSPDDIDRIESMYDIDSREPRELGTAAAHNTAVRTLADALDDRDVDHTIHGAVGEPGTEITTLSGELGVDFVIVGGRKRSPAGKAIFGSTAQDVLLNAPCPVIYTGPSVSQANEQ